MKTWVLEAGESVDLLADRAFTHGLGVFETLLGIRGELVRPDLHFKRMAAGCVRLGMEPPDEPAVWAALRSVLPEVRSPSARARARILRTAGSGGLRDLRGRRLLTVLSVEALPMAPDFARVVTSPWPRNEASPLAGIKCSSYAESLVALDHARRAGADELMFPNTRGMLCEAATANVFVVRGDRLLTPPLSSGCLPGTARERVIGLAKERGIEVVERPVTMDEARSADGLFLTSSTRGVVPVSRWDGREYPPGPVAVRLRAAFEESLENR